LSLKGKKYKILKTAYHKTGRHDNVKRDGQGLFTINCSQIKGKAHEFRNDFQFLIKIAYYSFQKRKITFLNL